jgi:hypothetical protein
LFWDELWNKGLAMSSITQLNQIKERLLRVNGISLHNYVEWAGETPRWKDFGQQLTRGRQQEWGVISQALNLQIGDCLFFSLTERMNGFGAALL